MGIFQVILVAVFMASFAAADYENPECQRSLQACAFPLAMKFGMHFQSAESLIALFKSVNMDTVCTSFLHPFVECVQEALDAVCERTETIDEVGNYLSLLSYVCSPEGIQVVESMKESPCLNDIYAFRAVGGLIDTCQQEAYTEETSHVEQAMLQGTEPDTHAVWCPLVAGMRTCMVGGVGMLCGDSFEEFFGQVWDRMSVSLTGGVDCSESLRRAAVFRKRSLADLFPL
ncbi:uncharacterized protein LOC101861341 isoform X2 [Aplysia californica]|nr:uncharacterized protein LOC101861341 isoform X2 [Aplysia californica]